jgi:O-antigen ligase
VASASGQRDVGGVVLDAWCGVSRIECFVMNVFSTMLFLLGIVSAGLFAIGMDPYSCGIPLVLMGLALVFGSWNRRQHGRPGWVFALVVLTSLFFGVQMFRAPVQDFGRSDGLLLAGAVLAFWWVWSSRTCMMRPLLGTLWLMVVANIVVACVQKYSDVDFYPIYGQRATNTYPSGLYLHYNHFANFMVGVGLLSFGVAMAGKVGRWMKISAWLIYIICFFGVYLATSRGAWLGMGCGSAVVLVGWLAYLWREKRPYAGVSLVAATVLAPAVIMLAWQFGSKVVEERSGGDSGRLEMASMALEMIEEKPLWGGGSRSFFFDSIRKWNAKELYIGSGDVQYVHNEYLQAAVDYGLIGLGLLLLVFSVVMFRGVALLTMGANDTDADEGMTLGAMAGLVGMGVQAFFSFVYHVLPDVLLMSMFVGILVSQPWALSSAAETAIEQDKGAVNWVGYGLVGSLLGLCVALFAFRDGAAWYVTRPGFNFPKPLLEVAAQRYEQAIAIRPDFRVMSDLSQVWMKMNRAEGESIETCKLRLERAIDNQVALLKRAPDSFHDRLNLALMFDSAGRFNDAEPIYEGIVDLLDARERFYGTRFHYTRHLFSRAHSVWRQREPERALILFMRAREQLRLMQSDYEGVDREAFSKEIEKCIKFLEGANIKPAENNE